MTIKRTAAALCAVAAMLAAGGARANERDARRGEAGQFDYYALALSWSPEYCANRDEGQQCAPGRRLGFVLHGLWPQYENGYPQNCSTEHVPEDVRRRYAPIYPSPRLAVHEWKKHGTCSGLGAAAYFALSGKLKDGVRIPDAYRQPAAPVRASNDELVRAFMQANPALPAGSVLPFCGDGGRFLREVRICHAKDGAGRACGPADAKRSAKSCGQPSFLMKNVR